MGRISQTQAKKESKWVKGPKLKEMYSKMNDKEQNGVSSKTPQSKPMEPKVEKTATA